ncbi:CBS domain-containing protein [bacterium]|nr:CBS domain-containing protein [bacterium]MCI0603143.1 CBS domain-containing protein [bacterium]
MRLKCGEIMTSDPVCCGPDDTVKKAAELMKAEDVGPLPVVEIESGRLVGIVTDRDLVLNVLARGLEASTTKVSEAMTLDPVCCKEEEPLENALEKMSTYQVRRLPVVDNQGLIVGIIAQADIATRIEDPEVAGEVVQEVSK